MYLTENQVCLCVYCNCGDQDMTTYTRVLYKANGLAVFEKTASGEGIRFWTSLQTVIYDMYELKL